MFRKLVTLVATAVATATLLGGAAIPAHADDTFLTLSIRPGAVPAVGLTYTPDTDLVGSVSGSLDGISFDATACHVSGPAPFAGAVASTQYVFAGCAGSADLTADLTTNADGTTTSSGTVNARRWHVRVGCDFTYDANGNLTSIDCWLRITRDS